MGKFSLLARYNQSSEIQITQIGLFTYLKRHGLKLSTLVELVNILKKEAPDIDWDGSLTFVINYP